MRGALPVFCCVLLQVLPATAAPRYVVDGNASALSPFTSWATAAAQIQDALDVSTDGDEIWVSNGVYAVGSRAVSGVVGDSRVAITNAVTVRSVNGRDFTTIQGGTNPVVRGVYLVPGALLDGFTVTRGAAVDGGGIFAASLSATVRNCRVETNFASGSGAGVWGGTVEDSLIRENDSNVIGSTGGGGAWASRLVRCEVVGNRTRHEGGGLSRGEAHYSVFVGNFVQNAGGAAAYSLIVSCVVTGNETSTSGFTGTGGGLYGCTTLNSRIVGNRATTAGGVSGGRVYSSIIERNLAGFVGGLDNSEIHNCVVISNIATAGTTLDIKGGSVHNSIVLASAAPSITNALVSYSICIPSYPGTGNLSVDPLLSSADDPLPLPGSPAREAGLNKAWHATAVDWAGAPRLQGARVDIGVYEMGPLDTDGDGLADDWELLHFTNLTVAGTTTDSDSDGMSDADEYRAGLQPTNAMSRLEVYPAESTDALGTAGRTVRWPGAEGRSYRVERSINLLAGFVVVGADAEGTPPINTYLDAGAPDAGSWIYRVILDP